jgi:hypothetical protein
MPFPLSVQELRSFPRFSFGRADVETPAPAVKRLLITKAVQPSGDTYEEAARSHRLNGDPSTACFGSSI